MEVYDYEWTVEEIERKPCNYARPHFVQSVPLDKLDLRGLMKYANSKKDCRVIG